MNLKKKHRLCSVFIFIVSVHAAFAQPDFYDPHIIQKIEIQFSGSDWDYRLDTARAGTDGYIPAEWVKVNGERFDSVGVKYKGNSSYNATYAKNPVHIALDEYREQAYRHFTDIKLGNNYADPSMIREVLSYGILKNYMVCPRANFAQLYINGDYIGLYSNDESVNKDFCSSRFFSSDNTFIKCNPLVNPGPNTKSNLKYFPGSDSSAYFNFYEIKSDYGWNDLVTLSDSLTNHPSGISSMMDADRVLWMLAFNNVLVNLDSYTGVFCQNYYLYKDNTNHYNPVIWDLNMSLGGFPYVGSSNNSMGGLTVTNMQQLLPTMHSADPYWPLINSVMNNATLKRMYIAHMRTITNEMFVSGLYQTDAAMLQAVIDTAVLSDSNKFYSYAQFQSAMTANNTVGSYIVPGISTLMSARVSYLQSTPEFLSVPPSFLSVAPSDTAPGVHDEVTVTAEVINANSNAVFLGYRAFITEKFTKVNMFDDGLHNDGLAGDNVYGATLNMTSANVQYYVYAENNNAGIFSPERAEHEFYSLHTGAQPPVPGQVVINEFLATNQSDEKDEDEEEEDWIELYNATSIPVNLFGSYLSDNYLSPMKFAFPENTILPAHGFLVVWADEDSSTSSYLHCNFKLSGNGEEIIFSNFYGSILDTVSFDAQTDDISIARCPDGNGAFMTSYIPSFDGPNCSREFSYTNDSLNNPMLFPNPSNDVLKILAGRNKGMNFELTNCLGSIVYYGVLATDLTEVNTSNLPRGFYMFRVGSTSRKIIIMH